MVSTQTQAARVVSELSLMVIREVIYRYMEICNINSCLPFIAAAKEDCLWSWTGKYTGHGFAKHNKRVPYSAPETVLPSNCFESVPFALCCFTILKYKVKRMCYGNFSFLKPGFCCFQLA